MSRATHHFPLLDQARFFAFLAVFVVHCFGQSNTSDPWLTSSIKSFSANGHLGVDFFFCLSAFLITYLLLGEQEAKSLRLSKFYLRRILRIWPLYFTVLILSFGGLPLLGFLLNRSFALPDLFPFLLFYANFYMLLEGIDFFFPLTFLWSIAIEEQFYLTWGVLMKFGQKGIIIISITLLATHLGFKLLSLEEPYFNTLTYLPYFSLGSLAAIALRNGFLKSQANSVLWLGILGILSLAILLPWLNQSNPFQFFEQSIWASFFSALIFGLCLRRGSSLRIAKLLGHLGKISYGLYCLHAFALLFVFQIWKHLNLEESSLLVLFVRPMLALLLSILLAEISYRLLEQPFLRLKRTLN